MFLRMKYRIRLLAIDIDGTLLDSRFQLSAANRDAVVAAHKSGLEVILVTGRRYSIAQPIAAQLPVPLTLITSNGALVKSSAGATLDRLMLPRHEAAKVLAATQACRQNTALFFDREGPGQIVVEELDRSHLPLDRYMKLHWNTLQQVKSLTEALVEDPIQILFIGPAGPMRILYDTLRDSACGAAVSLARTEYVDRDLSLVDVLAPGCNKGTALARHARRIAINPQEIMAIGDNWNDLEMLEFCGLPVLMGNSTAELKEKGWAVTAGKDQDGVAQAIWKYLLDD